MASFFMTSNESICITLMKLGENDSDKVLLMAPLPSIVFVNSTPISITAQPLNAAFLLLFYLISYVG